MRDYSIICCTKPSPVPPKFSCMCREIIEDYNELCKRYNKVTAKCQHTRLRELAEPKRIEPKYRDKCFRPSYSRVQLFDKTDHMAKTRTEQLALPKPRQISGLKKHKSFENFSNYRKSEVNRTLRKSLLSVYSRLMNVKHDHNGSKPKKINENAKNKLMENLQKLSTPKKDFSLVKKKKSGGDDSTPSMKRIRKLSKPKTYLSSEPNQWVLTDALKNYKPTERLLNISKPKSLSYIPLPNEPYSLTYADMSRINALAVPLRIKSMTSEKIENPFQTNRWALKAVASKRIIDLASPRDYIDVHNRTNPFKVSSAALKAKSSARIQKLAEPKKRKD